VSGVPIRGTNTARTARTVVWPGDHATPSVGHMRRALPPYRAVIAALRERIESGEWLPGEQIPSVRKIAQEYGVSVGTARRALVLLKEAGLIVITPSWGAFIPQQDQYEPEPMLVARLPCAYCGTRIRRLGERATVNYLFTYLTLSPPTPSKPWRSRV
jgi:Bacterial regulatory proteins, gntR family